MRRVVLAACAVMALAACGSSPSSSSHTSSAASRQRYPPISAGPIVFGVSVPLSGPTAAYGLATKLSLKVALSAFEAAHPGGIDGHRVEVKILDDRGDVTQAVSVAQQLSAEHVAGIITVTFNPEAADQQLAVFNRNKIPVVASITGPQYANTAAWPYDFGIGGSQQQQGTTGAQYIAARHYTRVATITDGIPTDVSALDALTSAMRAAARDAKVVKAVTVSPGSVDFSAAVAELRAAKPQLLAVYLGFGFGPLWSAMRLAGFRPQILATPDAWYSGFASMGALAKTAVTPYWDCADGSSQSFAPATTALMKSYATVTGDASINYLTYVANDTVPLELMRYAIERYHSTAPGAIKAAFESMPPTSFYGLTYQFSPSNHFGATSTYGAAVCKMGPPYAGGSAKVPVKATP